MKTSYLLILIFCSVYSFSQTEGDYTDYNKDKVVSILTPQEQDILNGYPDYNEIDEKAIEYYNKATGLIFTDTDLAIKYFLKAIEFDSKFIQAYDNLGKSYRSLEKYDLAIKYYKKSIAIFPNGDVAHQNLALVYGKQKKYDLAINEYKKLIDILPNSPEGYYGLADIFLSSNELALALTNAKKALEIYKKNPPNYIGDSYAQIGLIYYYLGDNSNAKIYIQNAKEKYTENNLEQIFKDTFPVSILEKLLIK